MAVFRPPTWIEYTRHKSFCFIGAQNEAVEVFIFSDSSTESLFDDKKISE